MEERIRFAVIGAGWRAKYYLRIAKKISSRFEVCAVLCRRKEKAEEIQAEFGVKTVMTPEEVVMEQPDFVVVAVTKTSIIAVSKEWLDRGFAVLAETPAAMDRETLKEVVRLEAQGVKLVSAEQYRYYPEHTAKLKLVNQGLLGIPQNLYLSHAHEYHAASLMRAYLQVEAGSPFTVCAQEWTYPTAETMTRYERVKDGRLADRKRTAALFTFADGRSCIYDFDSEEYRSLIRSCAMRLSGQKGELMNDTVRWLDEDGEAHCADLKKEIRTVQSDDPNPNFSEGKETVSILFENRFLYEPEYGLCGLTDDEAAIAHLLGQMKAYAAGNAESPYPLKEAIWDAYTAILLREAAASGGIIQSGSYDTLGL